LDEAEMISRTLERAALARAIDPRVTLDAHRKLTGAIFDTFLLVRGEATAAFWTIMGHGTIAWPDAPFLFPHSGAPGPPTLQRGLARSTMLLPAPLDNEVDESKVKTLANHILARWNDAFTGATPELARRLAERADGGMAWLYAAVIFHGLGRHEDELA